MSKSIEPGKGTLYHVIGGHGPGWQYETKIRDKMEKSQQFYKKHFKGYVEDDRRSQG